MIFDLHSAINFTSTFFTYIYRYFGIPRLTTASNKSLTPVSDGSFERFNRIVLKNRSLFVAKTQIDFHLIYRGTLLSTDVCYIKNGRMHLRCCMIVHICLAIFHVFHCVPCFQHDKYINLESLLKSVCRFYSKRINLFRNHVKTCYDINATVKIAWRILNEYGCINRSAYVDWVRNCSITGKILHTTMTSLNDVVFRIQKFSSNNTEVIHISMLDPAAYYLHKETTQDL